MAEDFPEYAKKFVAYINVDVAASGSGYSVRASPSLADLFADVSSIAAPPDTPTNASLKVGPLGSGSDFTGFLQHLGVASADLGYRPHAKDAIYQ
jgi:N-acetylated-alpha-linked acidic dipeptidase